MWVSDCECRDSVDPDRNLVKVLPILTMLSILARDVPILALGREPQGGGGALFREKIVEERAKKFIVIVDESKLCKGLGPG